MEKNQPQNTTVQPEPPLEAQAQAQAPISSQKKTNKTTLILIIALIVVALIAAFAFLWPKFSTPKVEEPVTVETPAVVAPAVFHELRGTISLSGVSPEATDPGSIHIYTRIAGGSDEFIDTGVSPTVQDGSSWEWTNSVRGTNYEVMAAYIKDDQVVKYSSIETVTAPAFNIDLNLNLNWSDLPWVGTTSTNTSVSGTVRINGYVPAGSSIVIEYEGADDSIPNGSLVVQWPVGAETVPFSWTTADLHHEFNLYAYLVDGNDEEIGRSTKDVLVKTGDNKVNLEINSHAKPAATPTPVATPATTSEATPVPTPTPAPVVPSKVKLSGRVVLNGPTDDGTSLLILVRKPGEGDYQAVGRIDNPNNDGQNWSWDQAEEGEHYEVTVALQVDEVNTSTPANSKVVTAPASGVDFTLNTNFFIPTPSGEATIQPCVRDGDKWKATITFPAIADAGNFWMEVGSKSNYNDIYNSKQHVSGSDYTITVRVDGGKEFFARYAFSACVDCTSDHNFSPFSETIGFTCE